MRNGVIVLIAKKGYLVSFLLLALLVVNLMDRRMVGKDFESGTFGNYKLSEDYSNYNVELTGSLIEDPNVALTEVVEPSLQTTSNGTLDNKVLRWGISRRTENQPPAADPGAPELLKRYDSFYIGDTNKKEIYLTFDEGYENGYTNKILDVLKENKVQGVFFITGPYLKEHEDLVKRMVDEGHIVGNHTVNHPSMPTIGDKELEDELTGLETEFYNKFGKKMKYVRPPKGEYSERTLAICKKLGYKNMFWSFAYDDWYRDKIRGGDYAYNIVTRNLHNGAVLLLHAVSKDNAEGLDKIIKGAKERGFVIGSVDDIK